MKKKRVKHWETFNNKRQTNRYFLPDFAIQSKTNRKMDLHCQNSKAMVKE